MACIFWIAKTKVIANIRKNNSSPVFFLFDGDCPGMVDLCCDWFFYQHDVPPGQQEP
ncbi:MAG: hypothetical protein LBC40_03910 [Dysgonamonadaceae bacterium]|nr:hypothetical protein [Dysgonamonadaceae bacterium]